MKAEGSAALQSYLMELHQEGQWVVHLDRVGSAARQHWSANP